MAPFFAHQHSGADPGRPEGIRKPPRCKYSPEQIAVLQAVFEHTRIPDRRLLHVLSYQTNLSAAQIKTWFSNRRHRLPKGSDSARSSPSPQTDQSVCERESSYIPSSSTSPYIPSSSSNASSYIPSTSSTSPYIPSSSYIPPPVGQHTQRGLLAAMLSVTPSPWTPQELVQLGNVARDLGTLFALPVPIVGTRLECPFDEALEYLTWDKRLEDYGAEAIAEAWAAAQ